MIIVSINLLYTLNVLHWKVLTKYMIGLLYDMLLLYRDKR